MSRLIIKNLPPYISEPKLRDHLASKPQPGELTDVRLVHKKDGSTRRIAFVGYKTEEQAASAKEYFDRTYLDISKLKVEAVTGTKGAPLGSKKRKRPREGVDDAEGSPRKRQRADKTPESKAAEVLSQGKKHKLDEFTKVMGTKSNTRPAWAADIGPDVLDRGKTKGSQKRTAQDIDGTKKKGKENVQESEESPILGDQEPEEVSDMEWMRRRMVSSEIKEDKAFEQSDDESMKGGREADEKTDEPANSLVDPNHLSILSNGRLFIRNLVFSCTEDELQGLFSKHGDVEQIHIPVDGSSQPKGFAYVRFRDPTHAVAAYDALDGTSFQGRLLHILPAVDRNPRPENDSSHGNGKSVSLKDARAQKKKESSGKDFNWAVLYMNSDAVANSVAERLGIPKADILNPDGSTIGGSPAVKLALAETHIIAETKKYFEQQNVDLSLFSKPRVPRCKTIILVKNIPYGTTASQLQEMFEQYGTVKKILLPPAGTIAIVQFPDGASKEAGNAWRGLAYKRLKDSVIYLEWAPEGLFDAQIQTNDSAKGKETSSTLQERNALPDASDDEEVPPGATLHIGNLSFATTSARLASLFRHLPSFAFAKVATKPDPKHPGQTLSQGYGFVGFKDVEGAKKAIKGVGDSLVLDGHVLRVSFAGRGKEEMEKESGAGVLGKGGKKVAKIVVKNLAFEVGKKELWELFSAHGQIKSIRLPNRADRRSRGFGFIEFASRKEAENAMERLRHTHLLGRHLVMEWAEREKGAEEMRAKTMLEYGQGEADDLGRKRKLRLGEEEDSNDLD